MSRASRHCGLVRLTRLSNVGREGLDGRVKLGSVSYAGPPGDLPLVGTTKHLCLALCGVLIALVCETYQSLRENALQGCWVLGLRSKVSTGKW